MSDAAYMERLSITTFEPAASDFDPDGGAAALERRRRSLRERHWSMLILCIVTIIASMALNLNPEGRVATPGAMTLPVTCGSRALFGIECPGCGLTRSFVALAHGDLQKSVAFHRVGWLLAAAVVGQLIYRPWMLYELRTKLPTRDWPTWFGSVLIAVLIGNWLLKIAGI
jgi:Protein of unknown function (DUF2752)